MLLKLEKVHHREFEVEKNCFKIFVFPNISQPIHIFYFSSQQAQRVLLGKQLFLKISVYFSRCFFPTKSLKNVCRDFYSNCTSAVSNFTLKAEVLHRLISSRNNTQQRCQSFSCSHGNLFLKVAGVRPLCSKCLKNICELFKNIMSCEQLDCK